MDRLLHPNRGGVIELDEPRIVLALRELGGDADEREITVLVVRRGPLAVDELAPSDEAGPARPGTVVRSRDGARTIRVLAGAGLYPAEVAVRQPSLEQLYVEITGGSA